MALAIMWSIVFCVPNIAQAATWHKGVPKTLRGKWDGGAFKNYDDSKRKHFTGYRESRFYLTNSFASQISVMLNKHKKINYVGVAAPYTHIKYKQLSKKKYQIKGSAIYTGRDRLNVYSKVLNLTIHVVSKNHITIAQPNRLTELYLRVK